MTAAAAPHRRTRRRDALGGSALALGLAGVCMGAFAARATWFVVVPLGLLTVILGLIDVSRAGHDAAASGRTAVTGVIAGAVALALGAWGTGMFLGELDQLSHNLSSPTTTHMPVPAPATVTWGQEYVFANGLTVTVARPTVTGTGTVTVSVTAGNSSSSPLTLDPPVATFAGRPVTDIAGATRITVPAGGSASLRLTYQLPGPAGQLSLAFGSPPAIVEGRV